MAEVGGPIRAVILAGREFPVPADNEAQRKLGGLENAVEANGDGSTRLIKTPVPWMVSGVALVTDDARGDHEFLQELSDRPDYFPVGVVYPSGATYQGRGQISGELQFANSSSTTTMDLSGPLKLTRQ